jgi:hypothetical protein
MEETIGEVKRYYLKPVSDKRREELRNEDPDKALDTWYDEQRKIALSGDRKCACCGADITNDLLSEKIWINRRNICHLLPKGKYDSVKTHPLNRIFLCWDHHTYIDGSWFKARKVNIWPEVVRTVRQFIHLVTESTGKLPPEFFEK